MTSIVRPRPVAQGGRSAVESAARTIETERNGLDVLREAMDGELGRSLTAAVESIAAAKGRVVVTGMGKSGHIGRKIAATLASTGTPAYYVHPGEASHGDLGMIQPDDVILALSWSGETRELADILSYAKRRRVPLIALTSNADSTLGREADICLALPRAREACPNNQAPTTSTTMTLTMGDALAVALLEERGFSALDFHAYHPGGKLGAELKQVSSVMHRGERLPVVPAGTPMTEALVIQSEKGFGCVIVTGPDGSLAGIVTDGDLRRHMGATLFTMSVDEVMTRGPTTIEPDTLLGEALEIVESRSISALVVVEAGRPVGLIHVLDLLRAGVA
ncbi:KpsF/GutQ family sugar-phosphate isomerase [Enterovirga rhinocerotis]|uniref:Arabinose-5-phosphate isomerase n=1 Tax=Enterovirga rhinocerotis TaxID=1339210 RepID=A0A4R7BU28_9HYPH|nr:KpsF/GutQ family sugar-phosphate isomerase [Enterovirga rhinocerotis]TDR88085.1 arabinose-5-phosphate isomerase [Enterovirga rhinocerotis]